MSVKNPANKLVEIFSEYEGKTLASILHCDPDPDAMVGGLALSHLAEPYGIDCSVFYGGEVFDPQNQSFANVCKLDLRKIDELAEGNFSLHALIDCSTLVRAGIQDLGIKPDIIIDHHPATTAKNGDYKLLDVRHNLGSVSTIFTEYIRQIGPELDINNEQHRILATALYFGIQSDTGKFRDEHHKLDKEAYDFLSPFVDKKNLGRIEYFPRPRYWFDMIALAAESIKKDKDQEENGFAIACLDYLHSQRRWVIYRIADELCWLEGYETALVFAIINKELFVSLRSHSDSVGLDRFITELFGKEHAGARFGKGGARVPLGPLAPDLDDPKKEREDYLAHLNAKVKRVARELMTGIEPQD